MKKVIIALGFSVSFILIGLGIYGLILSRGNNLDNGKGNTSVLSKIVDKINNSTSLKEVVGENVGLTAVYDDNTINVFVSEGSDEVIFKFLLNGNILSTTFENNLMNNMVTNILVDAVGQVHGYLEGEMFDSLTSDEINNYTLEKEGFEKKEVEDGSIQIKIDVTKKIPLVVSGGEYFEVADLEPKKQFIKGDGGIDEVKGNIWFNSRCYEGNCVLLVAEKPKVTNNTYKSIVSILTVMFDSEKAVSYFKENYSNLSNGDKIFEGFNIEVKPLDISDDESLIRFESDYELVRINIDKNVVLNKING